MDFLTWVILPILFMLLTCFYLYTKIKGAIYYFYPKMSKRKQNYLIILITIVLIVPAVRIYSTYFIVLVHFIVILFIIDCIVWLIKKIKKQEIQSKLFLVIYKSGMIALALTVMVIGYGYHHIYQIHRTEYTLQSNKALQNEYKIVLLSDLHYGITLNKEQLMKQVARINQEKADIVVLDGDLVDERTTYKQMKEAFHTLGKIKSTYGIYYVYGNHDQNDYASKPNYTKKQLAQTIIQSHIHILEDQTMTLNQELTLIGRVDRGDGTKNRKSIKDLTHHLNKNNEWIVLDHQPVEYQEVSKARCDVILLGHTHAGQIWPSGLLSTIFHVNELNYGNKKMNQLEAIVTSGIAGWGYPIRTENNSEYVVLNIK